MASQIKKPLMIAMLLWLTAASVSAEDSIHRPYNAVLQQYVETTSPHSTVVDYAALANDQEPLNQYLSTLKAISKEEYEQWSRERQLAFLINAYNAHTLALIIKHYDDIDSIKDIGGFFSSAWNQPVALLLGEKRTLDDIEHGMIRGQSRAFPGFNEPRIHFAVNCASVGCPALREEAYTAQKLEQQLSEQTQRFLSDESRNRMTKDGLRVSKIFDWYKEDFTAQKRSEKTGLGDFFSQYASAMKLTDAQQTQLSNNAVDIGFLEYDWSLNDTE
ncbi:DUF547 domain-containing protein [Alteromonas lipotrueiana]|uniref:DUF547 domain-containing protein n=1 Tax=Alteromonas lipotrueiana TaxID=2803815 RepID=UPI001C44DEDB|nr:DUF547 domain-containing protein [Alteromonas lipotrueiana]